MFVCLFLFQENLTKPNFVYLELTIYFFWSANSPITSKCDVKTLLALVFVGTSFEDNTVEKQPVVKLGNPACAISEEQCHQSSVDEDVKQSQQSEEDPSKYNRREPGISGFQIDLGMDYMCYSK